MSDVSVGGVFEGMKNPAIVAGGVLLGVVMQKGLNKFILGNETVQGFLGSETTENLKQYLSPAITTATGVIVGMQTQDGLMRKIATGVAISGVATVGFKMLWNKDLLGSLNGGFLGNILGLAELGDGDDEDFDGLGDIDDFGEVDEDVEPVSGIAQANIPLDQPALRDTNFEKETVMMGAMGDLVL